ncbi:MAG TPA: hypothetical protein VMT62_00090 [Syntrophorhabdaceae bacterium]|nr:hypothetical protein [Syntrophorhabdaceae bacterium]
MGIREIVGKIREIALVKLTGREGCVTEVDNQIVLCVKNESGHIMTGVKFDDDTPQMLRLVGVGMINRMVFDLGPQEASAIVASTIPKTNVHPIRRQDSPMQAH